MSDIEVVVINGQKFTPHDIMQMTPGQFEQHIEASQCDGCILDPCGPLDAAKCQGATLFDSVGE